MRIAYCWQKTCCHRPSAPADDEAFHAAPVHQAGQILQQAETAYQLRLLQLRQQAFLNLSARLNALKQQVGGAPQTLLTRLRPQWDALRFDYLAANDLLMDAMRNVSGAPTYFTAAADGMGYAESAVMRPEKIAAARVALQPTLDTEFARVVLNPHRLVAQLTVLTWLSPPTVSTVVAASPSPALLPRAGGSPKFSSCCG